jgi:hypothetical protein
VIVEVPHLKTATNLEKWRADFVLYSLWRVAHDRDHWRHLRTKPIHIVGSGRGGSLGGAAYLRVRVKALPALGIEAHELRLWRDDYIKAVRSLTSDQRHELKYHLARPRYSSVFRFHRRDGNVQLNDNVEGVLGEAALLISYATKVVDRLGSGPP